MKEVKSNIVLDMSFATPLEKLIKLAIKQFTNELDSIDKNIETLRESRKPVKEDLDAAKSVLQSICTHQKSHKVEGKYYPAGYDYVSESNYTIVCDNCGKVLESKTIRGTTFG